MTKRERNTLLKAAKLQHKGGSLYSCCNIQRAGRVNGLGFLLSDKYSSFYYPSIKPCIYIDKYGAWANDNSYSDSGKRKYRILMILLFREVGLKGIGE